MRLSDVSLRQRTVIAADGVAIGEIAALFIDSGLHIESVQVKLNNVVADRLGADRTVFHAATIEIPTSLVQSVGDAVVLSVNVDGLRHVLPRRDETGAR